MSTIFYELRFAGFDEIEELIKRNYPSITAVKFEQDQLRNCCRVRVTELDFGVWDWNEEII